MRSINKVILIGNLTRDPEMRQTPNGQSVTTFGLATNREWMTKESERKSSAEFHECVAWARLAEICEQYLKKGQLVYVEGYLKTRSWDSPEGVKKFKTEIVVKDMIRLEKRSKENGEDMDFLPSDHAEIDTIEDVKEEEGGEEEVVVAVAAAAVETSDNEETPTGEDPIDRDLGL
ncbi:MAG: single-stranded DNA-binding protein [bacterium]|nr:single-stranded DNA-binding protein [bacterium]